MGAIHLALKIILSDNQCVSILLRIIFVSPPIFECISRSNVAQRGETTPLVDKRTLDHLVSRGHSINRKRKKL
jgi:hypothetical protein